MIWIIGVGLANARCLSIQNLLDTPIFECDLSGDCTFSNDALCELVGLPHEKMIGRGWLEGIIPSEREFVFDAWSSAIEKRLPYECAYTVRNKTTGKYAKIVTKAVPLVGKTGMYGYLGIFKEIEPVEIKSPMRQVQYRHDSTDNKIYITLSCGHKHWGQNTKEVRDYLDKNPLFECSKCSKGLKSLEVKDSDQ